MNFPIKYMNYSQKHNQRDNNNSNRPMRLTILHYINVCDEYIQ